MSDSRPPPRLGFIGAGRMATALARGCVGAGIAQSDMIVASDPHAAARQAFAEQLPGAEVTNDNVEVLAAADAVLLAVKPQKMAEALQSLCDADQPSRLFISIAAGVTLEQLTKQLPENSRLIRVMPNTPCLIGMGASCFARGASASDEDTDLVRRLLSAVGEVYEVEERQLDAVTGLSGSGPAFVYTVIEALAAGGVAAGLGEDLALQLAAQTTRGAAEMVRQSGQSPAELREQVTSPGGTTLAGLESLARDRGGEALQAAVEAAAERSAELGRA